MVQDKSVSRRRFLKLAGSGAGVTALVSGIPAGVALSAGHAGTAAQTASATPAAAGAAAEQILRIVNPVGEAATALQAPAARLDTLKGKRIGVYIARRANAFEVMGRIAANLEKDYGAIVLGGKEGTIWAKKTYDREGPIAELLAEKPDAVVMGLSS